MARKEQSERFTTLSPILDDDHGKRTSYPGFAGEVPDNNVGFVPKEQNDGKK